jgi:hypothetical protein
MEHPAHSPDLASLDFHPFGLLEEALGRRFHCGDVKYMVHQWQCNQRLSIMMALRS